MKKTSSFFTLLTITIILLLSTVVQAAEYREVNKKVNADDILIHIEKGDDIYLFNCRIVGELNTSRINLIETVPSSSYYNLLNEGYDKEDMNIFGISENLHVIKNNITFRNSSFENVLKFSNVQFNGSVNFSGANFTSSVYFNNANFNSANFTYTNFNSADFSNANFTSSVCFSNANFNSADFTYANFNSADFTYANFNSVYFSGANFNSVDFTYANFTSHNYYETDFSNANFKYVHFCNANFNSADFSEANFNYDYFNPNSTDISTDLYNENMKVGYFSYCTIPESYNFNDFYYADNEDNANFSGANFNSANFYLTIFNCVDFSNAKFNSVDFESTIFNCADFIYASFNSSDFSSATFTSPANFRSANFNSTNFHKVYFNYGYSFNDLSTDFSNANFNCVDFSKANFKSVDFSKANFNYVDFTNAKFESADFSNENFNSTNFSGADFSNSVYFSNANFNYVYFTNTNFDYADFSNTNFNCTDFKSANFNSANFSDAIFNIPTDFSNANFIGSSDVYLPKTSEKIITNGKTCAILTKIYNEKAQYTDADNIYYNFRKKSMDDESFISFSKWIDICSWATCGYGTSLYNTIFFILFFIFFFAIIYRNPRIIFTKSKNNIPFPKVHLGKPGIYKSSEETKEIKSKVSFSECLYFSINTFTRLGSENWRHRDNLWGVVTIEGLLGWIMLGIFISTLMHLLVRY